MEKEWESSDQGGVVEVSVPAFVDTMPAAPEAPEKPPVVRPFTELRGSVARALLISWAIFAVVVLAAFGGKLDVLFNLGVVFAFGGVFFGVPLVLLRIKRKKEVTAKVYVDTPNGRMPQNEVMAQIIMVPLILSVGMAVIGYMATHQ